MSDAPTPASTVILLRDGDAGMQVFLVRRHGRSGFMPSMWVFPGGRLEPADALAPTLGADDAVHRTGLADARALYVGAVRETFEESGIWLGESRPPTSEQRAALAAGTLDMPTVLAGAPLALHGLRPWARWVTPHGEGRRFDALFLVARAPGDPGDGGGDHDGVETVDSGWFTPREVLDGGFVARPLAPPTFWAIWELSAFERVDDALAAARDLRPVQPVRGVHDGRLSMLLPGHPEHPEPTRPGLPARIDLGHDQWMPVFAG